LPFGEDFGESGNQEKHHLTSYERDSASPFDYAVSRIYTSAIGRFQSADPYQATNYVADPQSWNRFTYVGSDPINYVDPIGLLKRASNPPNANSFADAEYGSSPEIEYTDNNPEEGAGHGYIPDQAALLKAFEICRNEAATHFGESMMMILQKYGSQLDDLFAGKDFTAQQIVTMIVASTFRAFLKNPKSWPAVGEVVAGVLFAAAIVLSVSETFILGKAAYRSIKDTIQYYQASTDCEQTYLNDGGDRGVIPELKVPLIP